MKLNVTSYYPTLKLHGELTLTADALNIKGESYPLKHVVAYSEAEQWAIVELTWQIVLEGQATAHEFSPDGQWLNVQLAGNNSSPVTVKRRNAVFLEPSTIAQVSG